MEVPTNVGVMRAHVGFEASEDGGPSLPFHVGPILRLLSCPRDFASSDTVMRHRVIPAKDFLYIIYAQDSARLHEGSLVTHRAYHLIGVAC
jgi:hypothetical protein